MDTADKGSRGFSLSSQCCITAALQSSPLLNACVYRTVSHGYHYQHSFNRMAGRLEGNTGKYAADANMWSGRSMGFLSVFSV